MARPPLSLWTPADDDGTSIKRFEWSADGGDVPKELWGDWIDTMPWSMWGTVTFRRLPTSRNVRSAFRAIHRDLRPDRMFFATEAGSRTGRYHGHAVALWEPHPYLRAPVPEEVELYCSRKFGFAEWEAFDKGKGASHYVAKYVSKGLSDFDLLVRQCKN